MPGHGPPKRKLDERGGGRGRGRGQGCQHAAMEQLWSGPVGVSITILQLISRLRSDRSILLESQ